MKHIALLTALLVGASFPATADVFYGGNLMFKFEQDTGANTISLSGETVVGYDTDQWSFGVGLRFQAEAGDSPLIDQDDAFVLARYQNFTLSYGNMYGAGNMNSEEYFGINDTTGRGTGTIRIDYAGNGYHVALSRDSDGEAEFGFAFELPQGFVRLGYEHDAEDLQIIYGRDFERWSYHLFYHDDLGESGFSDHGGVSVFTDLNDNLRIGANIAISPGEGLRSYGAIAWYRIGGSASSFGQTHVRAEYNNNVSGSSNYFKISVVVPFGKSLPAWQERFASKDALWGFGF